MWVRPAIGLVCFHPLVKAVSARSLHSKFTIFPFVEEKTTCGEIPSLCMSPYYVPGFVRGARYQCLHSRHSEPTDNIY